MPTYTTPPVWYNKTGSKINIFNNDTYYYNSLSGINNIAIGQGSIAGNSSGDIFSAIAIGDYSKAINDGAIAIGTQDDNSGNLTKAVGTYSIAIGTGAQTGPDSDDGEADGIAIGGGSRSYKGGIAIGRSASADGNVIQLGNNNQSYTLNIGNGTGTIQAGSYKIGEKIVIDNNRSISGNSLNINNNKLRVSSNGSVSSKNYIYTTDFVSAYSYRINNRFGDYTTVIDSDKNIVGNSIEATGDINTSSNIQTNGMNRITSTGIMAPSKFDFSTMSNCAYTTDTLVKYIEVNVPSGTTRHGSSSFGANIPRQGYDAGQASRQLLLAVVSIKTNLEVADPNYFQSVYTGFLTGVIGANQGTCIFPVYTGDGNGLGHSWGTIRLSYQPYSWFDYVNRPGVRNAPMCYLSYDRKESFDNVSCTIKVSLYPIGIFGLNSI